jgi:DNA-binding CsgD family transcriptional regulator
MQNLCQTYLEAAVTKKEKRDPLSSLTPREEELFKLVITGTKNKDIAQQLSISEHTVRNHIARIFSKLKVNNRTEAAFMWHSNQQDKYMAGEYVRPNSSANPSSGKVWVPKLHHLEQKYSKSGGSK